MSYVVTWWEGAARSSIQRTDEQAAQRAALFLRKRSDAYTDHSLVPIRVMSQAVYDHMQELDKAQDQTRCKHGLLRHCVTCLSSTLSGEIIKMVQRRCVSAKLPYSNPHHSIDVMIVKHIDDQKDRVLFYDTDNNCDDALAYHIIASPRQAKKVKVGDRVYYEHGGVNFGWFVHA